MRLVGFDYSRPYFYMVTIKRRKDRLVSFGRVVGNAVAHYFEPNWITMLFVDIIKTFHKTWFCIEPITCFAIMPDHIHLLIKIRDVEKRVSLSVVVRMLCRALEQAYFKEAASRAAASSTLTSGSQAAASSTLTNGSQVAVCTTLADGIPAGDGKRGAIGRSAGQHLFEFEWHDWIVSRDGQLAAFTKYIRENPKRHWLRKINAQYFGRVREIDFLGRKWWAYGNVELIHLPVLVPIQCHRYYKPGMKAWEDWLNRARRIGDGGAGVSTFMSDCEKACGHEIALAGGKFIVLSPENFPPAEGETMCAEGWKTRWHPSARLEPACAKGDLLCITLYEPLGRQPTKSELHQRCHEMGDIAMAGLGATFGIGWLRTAE